MVQAVEPSRPRQAYLHVQSSTAAGWEVSADPYWSTRKFIPAGVPTNRLHVSYFEREA